MAASTDQLHSHALKAEEHLEQLATGLAQIGADDQAVKAVTSMAGVMRKIAAGLAKGGTQPEEQPAEPVQPKQSMGQTIDQMPPPRA